MARDNGNLAASSSVGTNASCTVSIMPARLGRVFVTAGQEARQSRLFRSV